MTTALAAKGDKVEDGHMEGTTGSAHLQDAVLTLSGFWTAQGCVWLPPCDFEVPAATLHPDVFFGVLASEPFRFAYLQPVRRPLDGRHGRHPYRLAKHLQLQVMMAPSPDDVRELYLASLGEIGLELERHDIRFLEWNWDARTLAGSGKGWYVRLDGLGVTRITYIQKLAGRELDPVAVELTYGIERLMMIAGGARSAFQLRWSEGGADYGTLRRADEIEQSRYAVEVADVAFLRRSLDAFEQEATRCLEAGLRRPAYELAVKSLQSLDLLEARGDLLDGERLARVRRLRDLVTAVAQLGDQLGDQEAGRTSAAAAKGQPDGGGTGEGSAAAAGEETGDG